jgi:hypothetical protein
MERLFGTSLGTIDPDRRLRVASDFGKSVAGG